MFMPRKVVRRPRVWLQAAFVMSTLITTGNMAVEVNAQDRVELIQTFDNDGSFIREFRDTYWVDDQGRNRELRSEYRDYKPDGWGRTGRTLWEYDDNNRVVRQERYIPFKEAGSVDPDLYVLDWVQTTTYDPTRTVWTEMQRDRSGEVTNFKRSIRDVDMQGRPVFDITEYWIDGRWQPGVVSVGFRGQISERTVYAYGADHSVRINSVWSVNRSDWVPQARWTERWTVGADSVRMRSRERWHEGNWEMQIQDEVRIRDFREGQHSGQETTRSVLVGDDWIPTSRSLQLEDEVSGDVTHFAWIWQDGDWAPLSWTNLFYSENGLEGRLGYRWMNGAWESSGRSSYVFDAHGRLIDERTEIAVDGRWNTTYRKVVTFPTAIDVETGPASAALSIEVSPNPSNGQIVLHYAFEQTPPDRIRVVDVSGRTLRSMPWPGGNAFTGKVQLDLTDLPAGMYFLSMEGKMGVKTVTVVLF